MKYGIMFLHKNICTNKINMLKINLLNMIKTPERILSRGTRNHVDTI